MVKTETKKKGSIVGIVSKYLKECKEKKEKELEEIRERRRKRAAEKEASEDLYNFVCDLDFE